MVEIKTVLTVFGGDQDCIVFQISILVLLSDEESKPEPDRDPNDFRYDDASLVSYDDGTYT